ncbi:MAG TPA: hypothetical protein PL124_02980 [Candidatus Cloacimonadota bacterium]|nr:hypothetical protein [Candidatus Cloacimonadota bacterium]
MKTQDQNLDIFREPEESQETAEIQFILDQAANESAPVRACHTCADDFICTCHDNPLSNCVDYVELDETCLDCGNYSAWEETGTPEEYPCLICKHYKGLQGTKKEGIK